MSQSFRIKCFVGNSRLSKVNRVSRPKAARYPRKVGKFELIRVVECRPYSIGKLVYGIYKNGYENK